MLLVRRIYRELEEAIKHTAFQYFIGRVGDCVVVVFVEIRRILEGEGLGYA